MRFSHRLDRGVLYIISLFIIATLVYSQSGEQKLIVRHQRVGPVIDAQENDRYHLFSKDMGFIAAKLYLQPRDKRFLHIMGEKDGNPYMLVRGIDSELKRKLEARLEFMEREKNLPPSSPVFPIDLPAEISGDQPVKIRLVDNTELLGRITACTEDTIRFKTLSDIHIALPDDKIAALKWPRGKLVKGEFRRYDPSHNRLFFGPTGRTLSDGEGNFTDFYVFFPTLAVRVADYFMLGGGVSLIPGAESQLFYISPKVRVLHSNKFDLAAGFLFMGIPDEENAASVYSALSMGDPAGGVTLGVALPFVFEDNEFDIPAFLFGAETQVSNNVKLITENWLLTGDDDSLLLLSGGIRFFGERLAADIALVTSPEAVGDEGFPFLPGWTLT